MPVDEVESDVFETDPSDESEEDLGPARLREVEETVVYNSDWTTETIVRQLTKGNIDLAPRFQRRDAWQDSRKSTFIESLFLGLPIPQIVLAERKDRRGGFIVIDGKQRLNTLLRFAGESDDEPLKLKGLKVREDLNGLTLMDIEADERFSEDLAFFQNQTIRTVVIRNWPNDKVLYRVFLRLNTGSVTLAPQELRAALLPGPFVSFSNERSAASSAIQRALGLRRPDFRMRDVELLVRYYGFAEFLSEYRGNLKDFLDLTCKRLNKAWPQHEDRIKTEADLCDAAIEATFEIFGGGAFHRWAVGGYEGRFNRAVFDVMCFYFRVPSVARASIAKAVEVEQAYRRLSEDDPEFVEAVQSTTKSISATHTRLSRWGEALGAAIGTELSVPVLSENGITIPE